MPAPKASNKAKGNAKPKPTVLKIKVSGKPPHKAVGTAGKPATWPAISTVLPVNTNTQATASGLGVNKRAAVANSKTDHTTNTVAARHCSSSG